MTDPTPSEISKALYGSKKNKYNTASKEERTTDGITFDSKREMLRYLDLKKLLRAGTIRNLELQPVFPLMVNGVLVCKLIPDFRYESLDGKDVIEDVKSAGTRTPAYRIKNKLFHALFPALRIIET